MSRDSSTLVLTLTGSGAYPGTAALCRRGAFACPPSRAGPTTGTTTYLGVSREQAHLPAQQPSPGQDPRLPAAHAYPGRSRDHQQPPGPGPRASVRLTVRIL